MTQENPNRRTLYLVGGTMAAAVVVLLFLTQLGPRGDRRITSGELDGGSDRFGPGGLPEVNEDLKPPDIDEAGEIQTFDVNEPAPGSLKNFTYESPDDYGNLALRFLGGTMKTLPNGQTRIPDPRAWVYLSEEQVLYVTAEEAIVTGVSLAVESGRLLGSVRLQIFERTQRDGLVLEDIRDLDVLTAIPSVVIDSEDLALDRNLSEVSIEGHFIVRAENAAVAGRGMTAVFNELQNRIEYLKIEARESIVYRSPVPEEGDLPTDGSPPAKPAPGNQGEARADREADATPIDTSQYYEIKVSGGLAVIRGFEKDRVSIIGEQLDAEFAVNPNDLNQTMRADSTAPSDPRPELVIDRKTNRRRAGVAHSEPVFRSRRGTPIMLAALIAGLNGQPVGAGIENDADIPTSIDVASPFQTSKAKVPLPLFSSAGLEAEDIVILGQGPLEVRPLAEQPATLTGAGDVHALLTGDPVELRSHDGVAYCGQVEYRRGTELTHLLPAADGVVDIVLADGGSIRSAAPVLINSLTKTVEFTGGGTIDKPNDKAALTQQEPSTKATDRMDFGGGVTATWIGELKLSFDSTGEPGGGADGMGPIKAAEFTGSVRFEHSDGFALEADRLVAEFGDFDGILDERTLAFLTGYGNVRITSREGEIAGDRMEVTFELDDLLVDPKPEPVVVEFTGNVVAMDDVGNKLKMNYLRADLYKPTELRALIAAASNSEKKADDDRIRLITATDQIRIEMADGGRAVGDRLEAQPRAGTARLEGKTVIASKDTMRLVTTWIAMEQVVSESGETEESVVRAPSGVLVYMEIDDPKRDADPNQRVRDREDVWREIQDRLDRPVNKSGADSRLNGGDPANVAPGDQEDLEPTSKAHAVRIRWSKSMVFREGTIGNGEFWGDVLVESSPVPEEYNSIQADRLRFRLSGNLNVDGSIRRTERIAIVNDGDPIGAEALQGIDTGAFDLGMLGGTDGQGSGRKLMSMEAISESDEPARIQAKRYAEASRETPLTIFYISGPIIEYFDAAQQLKVVGDGKMFLHDARPEENSKPVAGAAQKTAKAQISGRGSTLFKWTGSILLKGGYGTKSMTIQDDVSVQHRPVEISATESNDRASTARGALPEGALDLWCQSLQATAGDGEAAADTDRIDALGISGQSMGDIKMLDADGSVYVATGLHRISAEELHFESATKLAVLSGTADAPVSVERVDAPTSFDAERVLWDLFADTITVEKPGAATVPGGSGR